MSLYEEWKKLSENQTSSSFKNFWDTYCKTEIRIYSEILNDPQKIHQGKFSELAAHWEAKPIYFMGFLDGVSSSVTQEFDLDSITEDSDITIEIELEKLYLNMLGAKAKHLYGLSQWEILFTEEQRHELLKKHRMSGVFIKDKNPGRNEPCSCGSGKKYKKCCGMAITESDEDSGAVSVEPNEGSGAVSAELNEDSVAVSAELNEDSGAVSAELNEDSVAVSAELNEDCVAVSTESAENSAADSAELDRNSSVASTE